LTSELIMRVLHFAQDKKIKSKELRSKAWNVLANIIQRTVQREQVKSFIPGIISGIHNEIRSGIDYKNQGNEVFTSVLKTFEIILISFLSISRVHQKNTMDILSTLGKEKTKDEFVENIEKRMALIFHVNTYHRLPSGGSARKALVTTANSILNHMKEGCAIDRLPLIETLLVASQDRSLEEPLKSLWNNHTPSINLHLKISEKLSTLFSEILSGLKDASATETVGRLGIACGYISILKEKTQYVVLSTIETIEAILIQAFAISSSDKIGSLKIRVKSSHFKDSFFPKLYLANIIDEEAIEKFDMLFTLLGQYDSSKTLLNLILRNIQQGHYINESLHALSAILCSFSDASNHFHILKILIYQLQKQEKSKESVNERHALNYKRLNILKCIQNCINGEFSQEVLIFVLFEMIVCFGSPYQLESQAAYSILFDLAQLYKEDSVYTFIASNTDYLIDEVCNRFQYLDIYPTTPKMLHALVQYIVDEQNNQLSDNVSSNVSIQNALLAMIQDITLAVFDALDVFLSNEQSSFSSTSFFAILKLIVQICNNRRKIMEKSVDGYASELNNKNESELKSQLKLIEKEQVTIATIMEKCVHFISVPQINLQSQTIEVIQEVIHYYHTHHLQGMAYNESRESPIFQLVSRIWEPMVSRLYEADTSIEVKIQIIQTLSKLVSICGEFLFDRLMKINVFFQLISVGQLDIYLRHYTERLKFVQSKTNVFNIQNDQNLEGFKSLKKDVKTEIYKDYQFTPKYRLLLACLDFYSCFIRSCGQKLNSASIKQYSEKWYVDNLVRHFMRFTHCHLPNDIVSKAIVVLKDLNQIAPEIVYVECLSLLHLSKKNVVNSKNLYHPDYKHQSSFHHYTSNEPYENSINQLVKQSL